MRGKILIVSSEYTGHGHKSIAESLKEQFQQLSPQHEVIVKNGFQFGGRRGHAWEMVYTPVTKYARPLWNAFYHITSRYYVVTNKYMAGIVSDSFVEYIKQEKPDLIVSVHPAFVGSLIDVVRKAGMDIPIAVVIADLVNFSRLWADDRADLILCPTNEAREILESWGIREDKLVITRFPVRQRFLNAVSAGAAEACAVKEPSILLVNGAERPETIMMIVNSVMEQVDATITIVAGRDEKLREKLSVEYAGKPKIRILGYCRNLEEYMRSHDILICRGSPNVLMEAVNCHIPVVMFGALPGQEKGNPLFMEKNNLGVRAHKKDAVADKIKLLLKDNGALLNRIRENQKNYSKEHAARKIVLALLELQEKTNAEKAVM